MTYQQILDVINLNIKQNGNEEITGDVMNAVLKLLLDFINKQTKDYKGYNGFITENSRPNNVRSGYWLANSKILDIHLKKIWKVLTAGILKGISPLLNIR